MGLLDLFKAKGKGASGGKPSASRGKRLDIPKRFGIQREAISGTMSKFYRARDKETGKIVGLKVLDKEKTRQFEARFPGLKKPTEGAISIQLKHPNIVETYEHGLTTDGEQYLVQEFIEGPGLNSLLIGKNQEMLEGTRMSLIRQIAEALKAVHAAGFIHRDVCPRNVMVEPNEGILKLIDFGLTIPNTPAFTGEGNRTGNPNYMAPELIKRRRTNEGVDIFAFGVTCFELLAFDLPWSRGLTGKAAMDHVSKPPRELLEVRPQTHPKLAEAIHWCLDQEAAKRCPSLEAFLKRIKEVQREDA